MCFTEVCVRQAAPTNDGHLVYTDALKTFAPIVSVHPYHARKFKLHVIHRARATVIKLPMIGQMTIAIALPGFNDFGRSVTPKLFFF